MNREMWICLGFKYSQIFILFGTGNCVLPDRMLGLFYQVKSVVFLDVPILRLEMSVIDPWDVEDGQRNVKLLDVSEDLNCSCFGG